MNWGKRLRRFARGGAAGRSNDEWQAEVFRLYAALLESSRRLAAHAELAPNASAENELRRLADGQAEMAARLRAALEERALAIPPLASTTPGPTGQNHWARVVENLEEHRAIRTHLVEAARRIRDEEPELAALLESLSLNVETHLARLRSLVARADGQALD